MRNEYNELLWSAVLLGFSILIVITFMQECAPDFF